MIPPPPTSTLFPYTTLFRSTTVKEARERVRSAIRNSGLEFPRTRLTVNLAPAEMRKQGTGLEIRGRCCGSPTDRKSTRLNSSHSSISYAVFCLKKKKTTKQG